MTRSWFSVDEMFNLDRPLVRFSRVRVCRFEMAMGATERERRREFRWRTVSWAKTTGGTGATGGVAISAMAGTWGEAAMAITVGSRVGGIVICYN